MRRRLTDRTLAVSAPARRRRRGRAGRPARSAIDRQHDAGERARQSQAVIAAANLTEQRLLAVQTHVRGFLIRGNDDAARAATAQARAALPDATLDLQALVADDPGQPRRRERDPRRGARPTSTTTPTR